MKNRMTTMGALAPERRAEMLAEKVRKVAVQHDQIQDMLKKIRGQRLRHRKELPVAAPASSPGTAEPKVTAV